MCILYIPLFDRYVFLVAWWNLHIKVIFYGNKKLDLIIFSLLHFSHLKTWNFTFDWVRNHRCEDLGQVRLWFWKKNVEFFPFNQRRFPFDQIFQFGILNIPHDRWNYSIFQLVGLTLVSFAAVFLDVTQRSQKTAVKETRLTYPGHHFPIFSWKYELTKRKQIGDSLPFFTCFGVAWRLWSWNKQCTKWVCDDITFFSEASSFMHRKSMTHQGYDNSIFLTSPRVTFEWLSKLSALAAMPTLHVPYMYLHTTH